MQVAEIKTYLKKHKITYEQLAEKAGLSVSTIKKVFAGISQYPRLDTMQAIEEALGLSPKSNWTDEEKALGVTDKARVEVNTRQYEWLELGDEVYNSKGEQYYKVLCEMIKAVIAQK